MFENGGKDVEESVYISIDLKSFYASVECIERGLDPMRTNLVVADRSRTEKTICLAVSPALKRRGVAGRPRLFEVEQRVREINAERASEAPGRRLSGSSCDDVCLRENPGLAVAYLTAPPRMSLYIEWSAKIYQVYLKYIAPEDMHVYSIDEVFIDASDYLKTYGLSAEELARKMILDVQEETGITATAGIGTNLYLAKVAMDIVAKHMPPDENGVRTAVLDEMRYRRLLWTHRPLTDFWRVGRGYAAKLEEHGLFTMGDIARCSLGSSGEIHNEELLYRLFGVNAELLIDHAWGWESCRMEDIRAYRPESASICSGQVLQCPYTAEKARMVVREMTDLLALDLVDRRLATDQLVLTIGYDRENLRAQTAAGGYRGETVKDRYGRLIPKHAHGTVNLKSHTSSAQELLEAVTELYDRITDKSLLVRRVNISANHILEEDKIPEAEEAYEQLDLFTDYREEEERRRHKKEELERERRMQEAMLSIRKKFGKNAILRGVNLEEGSTLRDRNSQIGGHRA